MSTGIAEIDPVEKFLGRTLPAPPQFVAGGSDREERSVKGLRPLAAAYSWGAVLELATSLLEDHEDAVEGASASTPALSTMPGFLLPHERLTCDAYRGLALIQTLMVDRASSIVDALGSLGPENQVYRYEAYPEYYPEHKSGSFVPFELSFLAIEIRVRRGESTAIPECYALRELFPQHTSLLLSALVGYHLRAAQHDAAADVARSLALQQGATPRALLVYARVLLHIGDIREAARILKQAKPQIADSLSSSDVHSDVTADDVLRRVHSALLLAAQGHHEKALAENDAAADIASSIVSTGGNIGDEARYVRVFAKCNAGICLMQMGLLSEAIRRLEDCLREDCEAALDEGLVFNLCTMYDLAYPDEAADKKKVLLRLSSRFGRQGFNLDIA
jgi:trafficking protein particle complex subunit 12